MGSGIRPGDSLNPLLFSVIIDKIIENVKQQPGYRLGNHHINILCYAIDVVLLAKSEDDLQKMLYKFVTDSKKYYMKINTEKRKSLVISKEPVRCKLEVEGKTIEHVMAFKYLGVNITSKRTSRRRDKAI